MLNATVNEAAAVGKPVRLYYTGLNINTTAASRAGWAVAADTNESELKIGSVVILDPCGHDEGKGIDVTRPQTSYLRNRAFVVTSVDPAVNDFDTASALSNKRRGGWIEAVPVANSIEVRTKANMTIGATPLGLTNATFNLTAVSDSALDTTVEITPFKALAQQTVDTSTTSALATCQFGLWN
jgi:hypothetical protein